MIRESRLEQGVTINEQRYYGKYRGRVVDNADPLEMGRIKIEVPAIAGNEPLGWALPCVPLAGDGYGMYTVPETDALVWVEFEGGDISYPVWVGCFWAPGQLPDGAEPGVYMVKTPGGTIFRINDNDEKTDLTTAGGHELVLADGDDTITITHSGGASITVEGDTVTIDSGSTKIVLDSSAVNVNEGSLEVT